jgi:hypothetical protein
MRPKKKSPQDERLEESIAQLIASYESRNSTGTLRRLGEFLSTPINVGDAPDVGDTPDVGSIAGVALTILLTILRVFILKS